MKKAQSISINTIIIAAIGLAVLVVLFAIFTGRLGSFATGVKETDTCQQKCSALGMLKRTAADEFACSGLNGNVIGGKYSDSATGVCCCAP